jgi:hypothetical protein
MKAAGFFEKPNVSKVEHFIVFQKANITESKQYAVITLN